MSRLRCVYLDLDGTLLGRGGSLLHDGEGAVTLLGVRAIEACLRADVEVVLVSGRRRTQVAEDARLLGQTAYIHEAGAALVLDGEHLWMADPYEPEDELSIFQQISRDGAPELLLDRYADRLEYHDPYHLDREVSHLFRGLIDAFEADALLAENGLDGLRLVDNGVVQRRSALLADLPQVRAYHLVPAGVSKANAVARHMRIRGCEPDEVIGIGDSREDMGLGGVVGTIWLVANALERDPTLREALAPNARVADAGHGPGVYEAVVTELAERRG